MMREEPLHTSKIAKKILNRKGSTLLSALIMGVIVVIMIFSSAVYIRSRAQAVVASSNKMDNRIALDGMLAYTLNGIKQSWCFSDTWMKQPNCILTDARNSARLLISDESLAYIGASTAIRPTPITATRLRQITQTVNLSSVNKSHPLFSIARPLDGKYDDVTFTIKRDDSAIATTKGREVRLKILVYLRAASGDKGDDLELDSQVIVYPRELSYFGLIIPGNLYLGNTATAVGDVGLAQYASAADKGLRFESPVYVNSNLYLPNANVATPMSNVVFLDKVVIGGGGISQGSNVFRPVTAGGTGSMYNHEMKSFSGFLGGYELDEARDAGLDILFKIQPTSFDLAASDYETCLKRIQASYDLSVTKNSLLFMRFDGAVGPDSFNISANIGNIDNLNEQEIVSTDAYNIQVSPEIKAAAPNFKAGTVDSLEGGAIFKVKVIYAGLKPVPSLPRGVYESEFYLSRSARVTLAPQGITATPTITVTTSPFNYGGNDQFNQSNINVTYGGVSSLDLAAYTENGIVVQPSIKFAFEAFDYAYNFGENLRQPNNMDVTEPQLGIYKSNGFTFFRTGNMMQIAQTSTAWSTNELLNDDKSGALKLWEPAPIARDWTALDAACMAPPDSSSGAAANASFPSANWGTSFTDQAEHAWRFSTEFPGGYESGTVNFGAGTNRFDPTIALYPKFEIKSVIKNCVIKSTANFVAGFYTCENLTIESRTDPLRIIGTFIVGKLNIDNSAYAAGIRWSSIYHPQALYEMRAAKVLGRYKDNNSFVPDCNSAGLPPLWSPNIGIVSALSHYLCNPVSLRTADPFKWTMVDPDCGIDPTVDKNKVSCKSQPRRFLIKEVSRTKGM